ncbi:MAG: hypothetical protein ACRBCJ_01605 [Hyphomicrobiaceae bacterium]
MKIQKIIVLVVSCLLASHSAVAFQEEQVGTTAEGVVVEKAPDLASQFDSAAGTAGTDKGLEVRIPGLGSLGVLPKMDFGLELLYGASDSPETTDPNVDGLSTEDGNLSVRGSVKHRF